MWTNKEMIQASLIGAACILMALKYHGEKALAWHRTSSAYLTLIGAFGSLSWMGWIVVGAGFVCLVRMLDCSVVAAALSALYLLQRGHEFADAKRDTRIATSDSMPLRIRRIADAVHHTQLCIEGKRYTFLIKSVDCELNVYTLLPQRDGACLDLIDVQLLSDVLVPYALWISIATDNFVKKYTTTNSS